MNASQQPQPADEPAQPDGIRLPIAAKGGERRAAARGGVAGSPVEALLEAPEQVLSTLNRDGSRRWLQPRLSAGRFLSSRRAVAYLLVVLFTALPHIELNGRPAMLLDVARREFTFFGTTFLPTETAILALFAIAFVVAIFLFTALFGRFWCGWACPQTVYLEFLYRPLERLFDGTRGRGGAPGRTRPAWATMLLYLTYLAASLFLAHTFLAYFVGAEELALWMQRSPLEHPGSFAVMAVTTFLMLFNFGYFREQTCLVACPYGRMQSVLLDRDSLIITYDAKRGEPRGKLRRSEEPADDAARRGDCIDCGLCVSTCPTGIDIRKGLQMECVGCAQCIDACDAVMAKIRKPLGLIRYDSEARLDGRTSRILRPRVLAYAAVFAVLVTILSLLIGGRSSADVRVLRGLGLPFHELADGSIANPVRVRITHRGESPAEYTIEILGVEEARLDIENPPIRLARGETRTAELLVIRSRDHVRDGSVESYLRVSDGAEFSQELRFLLLGPADAGSEP